MRTDSPRSVFTLTRDVFVHSLNILQEVNEFLERPVFVSSAIVELHKKQDSFGSPETEKKWMKLLFYTFGFLDTCIH